MDSSSFPHLAFVYGTLKRGENNYDYWLADPKEAVFVGEARTTERYPFFINLAPTHKGCSPCVLDLPNATPECQQVEGELFLISAKMRAWLDVLENISGGTYVTREVPMELTTPATVEEGLLQPHKGEGQTLMGTLYFRANKYPTDWAAAKDCTRLLRSFSAAQMLKEYGKRFIGAPAHLQPEVARPMQLELNALPEAFRPPTSLETVESEEDYYGAPLRPPPIVLFIIDGVGDNTYPELGNRTPLEVVAGVEPRECAIEKHASSSLWTEAETYCQANGGTSLKSRLTPFYNPALSAVARQGVSGMLDPYEAGRSCGSDTAHLSLFGYPPTEYYRGRGAYEALGAGLQLGEGDIAFKSNFCTQLETTATDEEALRYNQQNFFDLHPDKSTEAVLQEVRAQWTAAGEDPTAFITFRRCDRDFTREGPILCEYLNDTVVDTDREGVPLPFVHRIKVQYATEHRCGLSLTEGTPNTAYTKNKYDRYLDLEGELSDYITGTDPLKDGRYLLRCKPKSNADATKSERELRTAAYTSLVVETSLTGDHGASVCPSHQRGAKGTQPTTLRATPAGGEG
ncbi:phosphoglycerate mutase [Angomonas deanei]|nr:phosphoglycerate mutase [Angomonas deanei]|eukprot:EPY29133.1 phosphoglycerate mutase [Angomonas deanei]